MHWHPPNLWFLNVEDFAPLLYPPSRRSQVSKPFSSFSHLPTPPSPSSTAPHPPSRVPCSLTRLSFRINDFFYESPSSQEKRPPFHPVEIGRTPGLHPQPRPERPRASRRSNGGRLGPGAPAATSPREARRSPAKGRLDVPHVCRLEVTREERRAPRSGTRSLGA